jgi:glycosyltransferase involved in cell wall biosynthesis
VKVLFVHQNFPAQYLHLAAHLARDPANEVVAITQRQAPAIAGVKVLRYAPPPRAARGVHRHLAELDAGVANGHAVARVASALRDAGFVPDVMVGHNGWGEIWFLKDVFPHAPLLGYFEFFYGAHGADVGFDPAEPARPDDAERLRLKNAGNLLGLAAVDRGQCPTRWQLERYPRRFHPLLTQLHEGIATSVAKPDPDASLELAKAGIELKAGDEVVTYVARNLERYRGFPSFMRALPAILAARPRARVLIVGGSEVSYGPQPPINAPVLRQQMLQELAGSLDLGRVHFLGRVPHASFVRILQVSMAHVYLTYPFVLSWSMLEAMAAGCLVVGSRTAPVEEVVVDGDNGVLADFFSPADIAAKVIAALGFPHEHAPLRRRARETILQRYDLDSVCLPAQTALLADLAG